MNLTHTFVHLYTSSTSSSAVESPLLIGLSQISPVSWLESAQYLPSICIGCSSSAAFSDIRCLLENYPTPMVIYSFYYSDLCCHFDELICSGISVTLVYISPLSHSISNTKKFNATINWILSMNHLSSKSKWRKYFDK